MGSFIGSGESIIYYCYGAENNTKPALNTSGSSSLFFYHVIQGTNLHWIFPLIVTSDEVNLSLKQMKTLNNQLV